MNKKIKLALIIVLIAGILSSGYYFLFYRPDKAGNTVADNTFGWKFPTVKFPITGPNDVAYSDLRKKGGVPQGLPVRLKIPIIGVDSAIEDALITPDGRMDVPVGSVNVAWFALGPNPGEIGSAVIGGHFGIKKGVPFVFYKLDNLKIGDKVYIENDKGDTISFQVISIKLFNRDDDATTVFTSEDGLAHLNLITCEGIWNKVKGVYPERRVVFTDVISEEDTTSINTFPRSLYIGSRGVDVIDLQKIIGAIPSDGIFGPMTKSKVKIWQANNGLVADGSFGPISRAKAISEYSKVSVIPTLPTAAIDTILSTPEKPATIFQRFIQSIKNLYIKIMN